MDADSASIRPDVDGVFCNARLRRGPTGDAEPLIQLGSTGLRKYAWVGGRVTVEDGHVVFRGSELQVNLHNDLDPRFITGNVKFAAIVPVEAIESATAERGVAPYVAVRTHDGAELQLRAGPFGRHGQRVIDAIEAERARQASEPAG